MERFGLVRVAEIAREVRFTQEERRGILSYLLLRTLLKRPGTRTGPLSFGGLYEHVCARLKEHYADHPKSPRQSPMLFGNRTLPFPATHHFGSTSGDACSEHQKPAFLVFKTSTGVIRLLAGQAHGVSDGDVFTLCSPNDATKPHARRRNQVLAQVAKAGSLMSTLELQTSQVVSTHPHHTFTTPASLPPVEAGIYMLGWSTNTAMKTEPTSTSRCLVMADGLFPFLAQLLRSYRLSSGAQPSAPSRVRSLYIDSGNSTK